ncbi:MAG: hypothetical protein MZW92_13225 [Comamonadaceae bacterium]|nr:hypothetical protein [Comamonadaceae bacterium]
MAVGEPHRTAHRIGHWRRRLPHASNSPDGTHAHLAAARAGCILMPCSGVPLPTHQRDSRLRLEQRSHRGGWCPSRDGSGIRLLSELRTPGAADQHPRHALPGAGRGSAGWRGWK